jgi:hypothetical protein
MENLKDLLTIEDACRMSGFSRKTVKKMFEHDMVRVDGFMKPRIRRETYDLKMQGQKETTK